MPFRRPLLILLPTLALGACSMVDREPYIYEDHEQVRQGKSMTVCYAASQPEGRAKADAVASARCDEFDLVARPIPGRHLRWQCDLAHPDRQSYRCQKPNDPLPSATQNVW